VGLRGCVAMGLVRSAHRLVSFPSQGEEVTDSCLPEHMDSRVKARRSPTDAPLSTWTAQVRVGVGVEVGGWGWGLGVGITGLELG
jgi:hypothetical protein